MAGFLQERVLTTNTDGNHAKHTNAKKMAREARFMGRSLRSRWILGQAQKAGAGLALRVGRGVLAALLALALVPVVPGGFGAAQEAWADDAPAMPAAAPTFTHHPADSTYSKGANARFYVRASSGDGGYLSYRWYRSRAYDNPVANASTPGAAQDGIKAIKIAEPNGTSSVLTTTTPNDIAKTTYYYYWVEVTNHKDTNNDGDTTDVGETNVLDSALAQVKVVNRTLFPAIQHGDFEAYNVSIATNATPLYSVAGKTGYAAGGTYNKWNINQVSGKTVGAPFTVLTTYPQYLPTDGYWDTTHYSTTSREFKVLEIQPGVHFLNSKGVPTWERENTSSPYYSGRTQNESMVAELAAYEGSSIFQEIATVPGKIYEWSLDHGARSSDNDKIAVIIGPAINEEADYAAFPNKRWSINTAVDSYGIDDDIKEILRTYRYGKNTDTYFQDILTQCADDQGEEILELNGAYSTTYGNKEFYVYVSTATNTQDFQHRAGSYTVPAGQGTTVFGFVRVNSESSSGGNILDNIVFASATGLNAEQEASYTGETSLSTPTQAGFAYALAEVRGSSVNELVGLSAYYNGSAIAPDGTLGTGGWYTNGSSGFATGGTITFKDLVPGKTYRIIGIPALAINTALHTNESPGNVLDNAYYKDVKIQAVFAGAANALPAWDVELYGTADGQKARVTLKNTNAQVQYALLADGGETPVTTGPALPGTAWKGSTSGSVTFEGLALGSTYWLVSRPAGYTEITYADAAWGSDGKRVAVQVSTPAADAVDLDAASVSRAVDKTTITIAATGTRAGYDYALFNPATGQIVTQFGGPFTHNGSDIKFSSLEPNTTYQVVSRLSGGAWLKGVRVYPYPSTFTADFVNNAVRSNADASNGFIPTNTEYRVQIAGGGAWLIGNPLTWKRGTGTERLELAQAGVTSDGKSIFGALGTGAGTVTVSYRLAPADGYVGASVQPVTEWTLPARPAAPPTSAVTIDYANEQLVASGAALQWRAENSSNYSALAANGEVDFETLGWNAAAGQRVALRYPAVAGSVFASHDSAVLTLSKRPDAPEGLMAALVLASDPGQGIIISNFLPGRSYEYSRSTEGERTWTAMPADGKLPYGTNFGDYDIRFAATNEAPASFYATVSSPLNTSALNLGSTVFGAVDATTPHYLTINNILSEEVTLEPDAITLTGTGSEYFTLAKPAASVTVPAANNSEVGQDKTSWSITPVAGIPAGSYLIQVNVAYSHGGSNYTCKSNVYFTVDKADWDLSGLSATVVPGSITSSSFAVSVSDVPAGAQLSYQLGGGAWSSYDAAGVATHTFNDGLAAARSYEVHVRVGSDGSVGSDTNHKESAAVTLLTVGTAQAQPDAAAVVHVNYADETLVFASGYQPDDYLVTVAGDSSGAPLTSGSSLIAWANASVGSSFTLQVVRKASALGAVTYPASTPGSLPVAGRAAAPVLGTGGITTTSASDDNTANGTINLTGTFQYRSYRNGVDVTTDWESASGSVNVTPGRYEVRRGPTSSAFGSAIAFVSVGSKSPSVSVFTKTALPTGGGSGSIVPEYLSLPSGWAPKAEEGQYDHSYLTSPLTLPAVEAVTSRSHIFRGWYGNPGLTGSAVTEVQDDNPYNAVHHNYYAKWVARPMVTTVAGATPVRDSNTASLGLTRDAPVKLAVTLPTGKNTLTLSDITLNGAAPGTAVLYPDASFSAAVGGGGLPLAWAGEDGYPTHAWLEVAALGDSAPQVYVDYELTLYTTRPVTVSAAAQVGGAGAAGADDLAGLGIRTTTGIALTFSEPVVGLTADDITLTNGTGQAVKGALSGSGASYTLAVSGVVQGTVNVAVADWAGYDVGNTAQPVAVYTDRTAPTGSISIEDNAFTEFLNTITFGLFFDETVDVTIAAEDVGGDGLASVQYLKTTADLGSAEAVLEVPDSDWEDGTVTGTGSAATGSASFAVEPNEKFFTYARFTDVTGNVAVINSDGTVVYTNSALDEDELSYTKLSGESKSLGVQLNGNTIADVAPAESLDEPLVRDEDYTVAEADGAATITLTAKYLESLSAGAAGVDHTEHTFAVLYNPLGEEFVSGAGGDGSDGSGAPNVPPATTTFTVDVVKATPNVELTVDPAPLAGVTYGDTITLRAVLTDSGTGAFDKAQPTGTVSFYKGTVAQGIRLNRVPVEVGGVGLRGRIDFSSSLIGANEVGHTFTAVYEGDENYKAVTPAPITGYRVNKAAQDALTVSEGDKAVTALGKPLDLEGGTFELSVEGGSGMGGYEWESSNLLVASVTPVEGSGNKRVTVKLLAVGNTTITAKRAGDSNHLATKAEVQLSVGKETTKPVPGGSAGITPNSTLAATNLGETSLTLSWAKATDAFPVGGSSALRYFVYSSDSTSNDIGTLADCLANGTLLNEGGSVDISELAVSELAADTPYWFNVVVVDESDNAAAYTSVRVVTPLAVELSGAVQYGGKNGRLDSTGVLLTFSNEVTGFEVAHVVVTVKGTTIEHGAITDAGDSDGATWLVSKPAGVTSAWANLDKASITVNGWAVSSGHSYRFANYTAASGASSTTWENIPLYAPVKRPLPTAAIDFEKELLTGLELGGFYAFASGTGDFGGGRTIGADGIYDHLPYNLPTTEETTLRVVQRGVGEDGEPGVDEQGYVDSDVQTLVVPARPAAPADFSVAQPDENTPTGGLTNLDSTKRYEYRSTTATDADWTDITYGATVLADLEPGPYYLRFEAVAAAGGTGGVFASESAAFYIHAYEAVDFADVLEGYELSQVPAQDVTLDAIVEAESVEWEDSPLAASQFTLAEDADSNTWTVQPKEGLAAGTYTAKLRIRYRENAINDAVQDVSFTVHPKAVLLSVKASSSADVGGKTDTLELTFKHPINLTWDSLVVGGAAEKSGTKFNSVSASENGENTVYTLAISSRDAYHSGDVIEVTVNLGNEYEFQKNTTGEASLQNTTATVVIPRAITSAHMIIVPEGWTPFILQFTFDKELTIVDPNQLEWLYTGTTYGADADKEPIRLTGTAASGATITGVYRVDADMGWTYRVTLNIAQSGSLAIGVPGWGVADFTVGDVTAGAWSPGGVAFFLDGEGHNYLTDLQSRQLLVEADALGGYVAPAYDLPTSVELDEGVDKVYIDGKPYDESSGLWSISGAGPKPYVFDGVAQPNLSDQLVVTLAEDWTRGEGDHEVIVVFGDDTVARGIITVEDIVATWPLTLRGSKGAAGFVPPADGSGGVGTGGEGVVTSEYGTGDGYFEAGRPVTITAAAADTGWRFDRWEQTPGDTAIELPASSPGTLTMPGEEADGLELTALYTDGVAPVSTLTLGGGGGGGAPADGGWTSTGLLTLAATDADVRAATGDNTTGAGLGAVASVTYKIDGRAAVTVAGAEASISLSSIAELGDGVHTIAYWAVDAAGNTEVVHTAQVGYDTTAPSGLIRLRGLVFDSFIAAPQFVRFYRGAVAVELAGTDEQGGSGVAQVEYLVHSGAAFGSESAASDAGGWMTADSFTLDAAATYDGTYIIYARITDAAGNKSVVATDGIVRYTDSALTATPPTFTKTSAVGVSAGLALHDNTVASVKLGGDGTVAGSAYNVTNGSLDFTATYLNSLPVPEGGSYSFTVQFNPQGLAYVPNGSVAGTGGGNGSGNNAPAEIVITIPMVKAPAVITLAAAPVKGTVFGNSTVLTAQVSAGANGTVATGEVKFFDDTALLGDGPVALRADGTAVLTVGFGAGPHALRVEYSGDGSFLANKSAVLSYSVDKAPQTAVSIERTDGTPVVGSLAVDYGDEPFALRAVGGSGGGAYEWSSDNTAVAAVDKATGTVTVAAVGSAIISVQRVGNDNYNPSAVTSFELKVERRPVRILSVAVADKGYDGTADAEFASTPVLDNVAPGDGQAIYVLLTDATAQFMTAPGGQPSADAGENKTVEVGGFTLGGAKLDSYELVSAPSVTTATISQATPVWDGSAGLGVTGGDSGDGALYYGQRLSRLALTGVVRGVNGEPLSGSLAWAPGVDVTGIPGSDPESALSGLAAGGYEYGAVFTPSGSFATNYRVLEGTVAVEVRQAEPGMAGGTGADAAPVGSPIFASDSGRTPPETLADSTTITGDVVFTYGGIATAIEGEWSWNEDDPDTATALADGYTGIGMKHPVALFTPDDPRIAPLTVAANVPVYSPRSEIVEEPAIGTVPYGGKVGDALIGEGGQVLAVAANDIDPDDYEDITAFGSWGWKNPELLITSKTGTQTAVLVFTPDPEYLVNLSTPPYDDRYLPAEKTVAITVEPVAPVPLGLVSDVPPLMLGQTLLESDVAAASYTFGGVAGLGEGVLTGTLAWADGSIEPGAAGYEADGLGGAVSESGLFVTRAIFTPDAALYGDAYASVPVDVTLVVAAREETQEALETVYEQMRDEVLLPVVAARANYRAEDVAAFEDALAAVNALLAEGTGSELAFGRAFDDLTVAKAALEHYHPILQHSALRPIAQTGAVGVTVEVGGVFESVASVSFNGVELDMTVGAGGSAGAGVRTLSLPASAGGVTVGTLSKGSAIVTLLPAFVDSLDNGKHVISVVFEDDYARGEQQAEFTIARPEEGGDGGGAGGAGGGGAGGGAGGGGGGADADADKDKEKTGPNTDADKDDDKDEDASGADEGDKPSTGGDKVGGTTDTGKGDSVPASGGSNALLILLALAGVAILLIGGTAFLLTLSKRRPHPDDDWR